MSFLRINFCIKISIVYINGLCQAMLLQLYVSHAIKYVDSFGFSNVVESICNVVKSFVPSSYHAQADEYIKQKRKFVHLYSEMFNVGLCWRLICSVGVNIIFSAQGNNTATHFALEHPNYSVLFESYTSTPPRQFLFN